VIAKYCNAKLINMSSHIVKDKIQKPLNELAAISDFFGCEKLNSINLKHIENVRNYFITEGLPPYRINEKLRLYYSFFEYCKSRGFIDENPVDGVSMTIPRPASKASTHTLVEVEAVINEIKNPYTKQVILFIFHTKLRPKEVFSLTVGDIDFKNDIVRFRRNWSRKKYEVDSIQMPEPVKVFCLQCAHSRDKDEILFPSIQHKRTGKPIVSVRTALKNASFRAGVFPAVTISSIISPQI